MIDAGQGGVKRRRRSIPLGFLGMVGLVIAIETNLAGHDVDFTDVWHWDWRLGGRDARRPTVVRDKGFLFFGDSLIKFALVPRVIGEATGKSARNFALQSGQASSSYFMLRRALQAGARPTAIVLDLTPHLLIHPPDENKNLWADLLSIGECLDFATTRRDADFFARTMLERTFPSLKVRLGIRSNLLAALQGGSASKRWLIPSYRRNWKVNEGAQLMVDAGIPSVNESQVVASLYSKWEPDPVNVAYLNRFLGLAAEHRIPVYWLLTPVFPGVQLGIDDNLFDLNHTNFVRATRSRFPGTIVIDARRSGFPPELFVDGMHLNRTGALKLSAAVAGVLREPDDGIGSPGWIYLDSSRARPYRGPIEDVRQSALALKAAAKKARR